MKDIRKNIKKKDYDKFKEIVHEERTLPICIRKSLNTSRKYSSYIENTISYPKYTNGYLEDINNKLKLIKQVAFGYRKLKNFKIRVLLY